MTSTLVGLAVVERNFSFVIDRFLAGMAQPGRLEDLDEELAFLRERGIRAIVSLTPAPLDAAALAAKGFRYLHLPVGDFAAPTLQQVDRFVSFVETFRQQTLAESRDAAGVVVHCGAGFGRTGTLLACFLVRRGLPPAEAIGQVRARRPGSIETGRQEDVVYAYAESLGRPARRAADEGV